MRVARGLLKGRNIPNKYSATTRAIESRIKDAIFDSIGSIYMARCLDLFTGTGALGIEALSRGAKEVIFNDIYSFKLKYISDLLKRWNFTSKNYSFIKMDAIKLIEALYKGEEKFDITFIDPPFFRDVQNINIAQLVLITLSKYPILTSNGLYIVRIYKKELLSIPENISVMRKKRYGISVVYMLSYK